MATAYRAPSLTALVREVDQRWPGRSKVSDGWVGDRAHAARVSDHNPDPDSGVVRAQDITVTGIDKGMLREAVIGDRRVAYVINDSTIWSAKYGWRARRYTGANPHTAHVHVSLLHTAAAETDTRPWLPEDDMTPDQLTDAVTAGVLAALRAPAVPVTRGGQPAGKSVLTILSNLDSAGYGTGPTAADLTVAVVAALAATGKGPTP